MPSVRLLRPPTSKRKCRIQDPLARLHSPLNQQNTIELVSNIAASSDSYFWVCSELDQLVMLVEDKR